ncbi:MAG: short-chain dehydrogenase/reductase [Gemmatimonadetes bacterium]|jgi:pteridine reductase|nr:short-chain dehydrogenase/reductase [Gemmatimonadota bacterium]
MTTLGGRVALVTGAGRRVGRAIALALGARGMRVVVHYHGSATGASDTVAMIEAAGGRASSISADLVRVPECERLIDDVVGREGELFALVNSAAVMERTPVGEVTPEQWDTMFALNARAPFFLAQRAAPALRAAEGCIVNIADLAAFESWPAYVPHGMTKAAVVQMTRSLARALAPSVRVNALAPGVVLLPEGWSEADAQHLRATTPLARLGSPDDVAHAVLFLLEARFITGEVIRVDGGRHIRI